METAFVHTGRICYPWLNALKDKETSVQDASNSHSQTTYTANQLDEKTGTLMVGPNGLDRERQSSYKFVVTVSDGAATLGRPALAPRERHVVQTVVHITVEDENDNAPRIIYPESHTATFTLACPILQQQLPHTIAQIAVNDSDTGINAEVFYHLSPATESIATERQSNIANSDLRNDSVNLNETTPGPTFTSSDPDVSNTIHLVPFQIDPQNGLLMIVNSPVDEQNRDICAMDRAHSSGISGASGVNGLTVLAEYRLRVIVTDRGIPPLSSSVILFVRIVPNAPMDSPDSPLRQPGQLPPYLVDRYNPRVGLSSAYDNPSGGNMDGTNQRLGKLHASLTPSLASDSRPGNESPLLTSLSSPDVFWAATICLTIATGVLIFLIVLITMVTCHRRMKPVARHNDGPGETRQNEWAQSDEGTYDSRYESRPFDNVEMNISKNSPAGEELFTLSDEPSMNLYVWSGRLKSTGNSPDLHGTGLCGSPKLTSMTGYSHLMTTMPHCRTLQNPLVQRSDLGRVDVLLRRSPSNASPCNANYEGYQKLMPTPRVNELDSRTSAHNTANTFNLALTNPVTSSVPRSNGRRDTQPSFHSEEDLRKVPSTTGTGLGAGVTGTLPRAPSTFASVTQKSCDTIDPEKSVAKSVGKKKNEVSFV
ncbi:unnamed protein product [Echinostoma caproni]|uniref:Cadherin domain-containing protein n=1 Tax=Echinostoma caproni TaxID=27848 RepID=A0A183A649_9TREM|nr:unnamed protein product [Echinostoma caproni]